MSKIKINFLWKIGRFIYKNQNKCLNITSKCSLFLSYYYGNSFLFSNENIFLFKKLYLYFPVYIDKMNSLKWDFYRELLQLKRNECYFYYRIVLFCNSELIDIKSMINNDIYYRI